MLLEKSFAVMSGEKRGGSRILSTGLEAFFNGSLLSVKRGLFASHDLRQRGRLENP
jgi:hypothetical protein